MTSNPIDYVELSADDVEDAAKFYASLFGWKIKHMPELNYTGFEAEPGPSGGFNPVGEMHKAGEVLVYVATDDIDARLAKVEALGGKTVVPKTEIPGVGWFGIFTDPTGNRLALFAEMGEQS
jgi:predicted enzyme related to lactoylglutathione lyase